MSVEAAAGWVIKLGWTPFVGWMLYSLKRKNTLDDRRNDDIDRKYNLLDTKLDEVFTKTETKELLQVGLKHQMELTDAKFSHLNSQIDSVLEMLKENQQRNIASDSQLKSDIGDIKTNIAVVVNKVENLEKRK